MKPGLPIAALAILSVGSSPASAQFGRLVGSTSGSYCTFKSKDRIRVTTSLPLDRSEAFARQMTLRRLASMARSKGFSALIVTDTGCGTLLINTVARSRSCTMVAQMSNALSVSADDGALSATADDRKSAEWFGVDTILRDTQADAPSYPVTSGLMNHGNRCVID